jgi:hypothetical protein
MNGAGVGTGAISWLRRKSEPDSLFGRGSGSLRGQGFAGLHGAADAELAHAGLQGGALHAQEICGAAGAGDAPLGLAKGAEDVLAFGFFQGGDGC